MCSKKVALICFFIVLLGVSLPFMSVKMQEVNEGWITRNVYDVDYGNGTHRVTSYIGVQVFWDNETNSWQELKFRYDATKKYYLLQNSHISLRVYEDKPSSYYDPDNQQLCVEKEIITVEYGDKGKWQQVDLKNPIFTVTMNETSIIQLTKSFYAENGWFNMTYILKSASFLKHEFVSSEGWLDGKTFRVHFIFEGVPSLKVKSPKGEEEISNITSLGKVPYFTFGENDTNLVLTESLVSLGVFSNETFGVWNATVLQDVILDVEEGKGKADVIIGNYSLAENESLTIDPATSTFQTGASSDDCSVYEVGATHPPWDSIDLTTESAPAGWTDVYDIYVGCGMRFTNVTVPQGATINDSKLRFYAKYSSSANTVNSNIQGEDVDDAATFSTIANLNARNRTTALVTWDSIGAWVINNWYNSTNTMSIIQEIVNRGGWASGNDLVMFWEDDGSTTSGEANRQGQSYDDDPTYSPILVITYTVSGNIENFYGSITQVFSISHVLAWAFGLSGVITQVFAVASELTWTFNLYSTITQVFSVSSLQTWGLSLQSTITQVFAVSSIQNWTFNLFGVINQLFTIGSNVNITQNVLSFYGSISQVFAIATVQAWAFNLAGIINILFTVVSTQEFVSQLLNFWGSIGQVFGISGGTVFTIPANYTTTGFVLAAIFLLLLVGLPIMVIIWRKQ